MTDIRKTSIALAALLTAVRQCNSNSQKGPLIYQSLKRDGDLAELIGAIHKELKWDVSPSLLKKCFVRAGIELKTPIETVPQTGVSIEVYMKDDIYLHYSICHETKGRVADGAFLRSDATHEVMSRLISMGVKVQLA